MTIVVSDRASDNELYDRGCGLVEAAAAIRRLADAPEDCRQCGAPRQGALTDPLKRAMRRGRLAAL